LEPRKEISQIKERSFSEDQTTPDLIEVEK